jgi:hypothetical protein
VIIYFGLFGLKITEVEQFLGLIFSQKSDVFINILATLGHFFHKTSGHIETNHRCTMLEKCATTFFESEMNRNAAFVEQSSTIECTRQLPPPPTSGNDL